MKNTSELKQGNYIKQSHLKTENVVLGIKPGFILTDCKVADGDWVGDALYEPIPLTEDWLMKFGLQENIHSDRNGRRYDLPDDRFEIHLEDDGDHNVVFEGNGLTYIKYVHQLQNLYFALTGEELTIKE